MGLAQWLRQAIARRTAQDRLDTARQPDPVAGRDVDRLGAGPTTTVAAMPGTLQNANGPAHACLQAWLGVAFLLTITTALAVACVSPPKDRPAKPKNVSADATEIRPSPTPPAEVLTPQPFASLPQLPTGTPSVNHLAFVTYFGQLWAVQPDFSGEKPLFITGEQFEWSPVGAWIAVLQPQALWIVSPDGSDRKRLVTVPAASGRLHGLAWSPDSSQIAFVQTVTAEPKEKAVLSTVRLADLSVTQWFTTTEAAPDVMAWSPYGDKLAAEPISWEKIWTVELSTGHVATFDLLPSCGGTLDDLQWSPDGRYLAHFHWGQGASPGWICVTDTVSGRSELVPTEDAIAIPAWDRATPILYVWTRKGPTLRRYDAVASAWLDPLPIALELSFGNAYLSLSPDGRRLFHLGYETSGRGYRYETINLETLTARSEPLAEHLLLSFRRSFVWLDNTHVVIQVESGSRGTEYILVSLNVDTGETRPLTSPRPIRSWLTPYGVTQ